MEAVRVSTFHPQTKTNSEDEFSKKIQRRRMAPWRRFNPRRRIPWGRISARRRITPPKKNSVCKETVLSTLCCTHPSPHLRWVPHEVFFSSVRFASWGACGENSVAPRAWTFTGCGTMDFQKPPRALALMVTGSTTEARHMILYKLYMLQVMLSAMVLNPPKMNKLDLFFSTVS